ncbi:hypothetical protein CHS0354_021714 [Potamilus streckersoni]|uniref:Uncharacterized protein n=1 Tax=Potamilus streckersoni TaxID=2493646 RepID=A0AAE0TKF0_9BIVA|nr:hypothetical protein CHS0354_021714 [Potamilus streckersoni]
MRLLVTYVDFGNIAIATLLDENFINAPDFLVADIRVDGERHFLLATEYQLGLLREAKLWYMDEILKANHYVACINICDTSTSSC